MFLNILTLSAPLILNHLFLLPGVLHLIFSLFGISVPFSHSFPSSLSQLPFHLSVLFPTQFFLDTFLDYLLQTKLVSVILCILKEFLSPVFIISYKLYYFISDTPKRLSTNTPNSTGPSSHSACNMVCTL